MEKINITEHCINGDAGSLAGETARRVNELIDEIVSIKQLLEQRTTVVKGKPKPPYYNIEKSTPMLDEQVEVLFNDNWIPAVFRKVNGANEFTPHNSEVVLGVKKWRYPR